MKTPMKAWILFAHGSSDPDWSQPMRRITQRLSDTLGADAVELAFLERQSPALEDAAKILIARGATHLTVVPMFLGIGGHLKRDLPLLIESLRARFPRLTIDLAAPIGESPQVADAIVATVLAKT